MFEPGGDAILINCLEESFPDAELIPLARKHWNHDDGLQFINLHIVHDEERVQHLSNVRSAYFALSAAAALFKFMEQKHFTVFHTASMQFKHISVEGTMFIDEETVGNLELVRNTFDGNVKKSLFGMLKVACSTVMGAKLLRSNILQPSTSADLLDSRLDAVTNFVENEQLFRGLRKTLACLKGLDCAKLVGSLITSVPQGIKMANNGKGRIRPDKEAERKIDVILRIRRLLRSVPALCNALKDVNVALLTQIRTILDDDRHETISHRIDEIINENGTSTTEKGSLGKLHVRINAVKDGPGLELLAVARATFCEGCQDISTLVQSTSEAFDLPSLSTSTISSKHGFKFECKLSEWQVSARDVQKKARNVNKKEKRVEFTTDDLDKKNLRILQSLEEIFLLSDEALDQLIDDIRSRIGVLYRSIDAIGLLDMLVAFAALAGTQGYVRPEYSSALAIKSGRHPLIERYQRNETPFVANDSFANPGNAFQSITGANFSGKSTYIRQVALIVILAQIGSFVPADFCSVPIYDCLMSRLSNDDMLEQGLSHFACEMRSMAKILSSIKTFKRPCVFVDELGRATSPLEGLAMAHAIAEELIASGAVCFFATHFVDLARTLSAKRNVVALNLAADIDRNRDEFRIVFNHRIQDGVTKLSHYGLELARAVAFPTKLVQRAQGIIAELDDVRKEYEEEAGAKMNARKRIVTRLYFTLEDIRDNATLDPEKMATELNLLQEAISEALYDTI